ncbi:tRNA1(Val) (adenine(37)-N6)-methyltransferase [Segatella buccae]|uniref:tRNA1(Val) (adenine(37)-N6)-methyltransferase n=1 Tax=Segatella buccae TaxID=28126 RepID=UPI0022E90CB3|nr:methyltransferase [Segatella buccae]
MTDGFRFRQFSVRHDRCAMKVGTDGVLLGAWAPGGRSILDIGTGTGLIALMMAQRFPEAHVTGIDIDGDAALQARENAADSPFGPRIEVAHSSLAGFVAAASPPLSFDSIVCNPPFFLHSLKNPDARRSVARHADSLPFADLFRGVAALLAPSGVFSAIVPAEVFEAFTAEASIAGLFVSRLTRVRTTPRKPPKRSLVAFSRLRPDTLAEEECVMSRADGSRSEWYRWLTAEFYL